MLGLIGVNHKAQVEIREKLSFLPKKLSLALENLKKVFREAVIISTCNRTEVYISYEDKNLELIDTVFEILGWDKELSPYVFCHQEKAVARHLMEVSCGFDSLTLGEDQILFQIKEGYALSKEHDAVNGELDRLFQSAIACSKKFRTEAELYKIPVSNASIIVKKALKQGHRRFMLLGYGEMGKLVMKHLLESDFEEAIIAVRNMGSVDNVDNRVKAVAFAERKEHYKDVDCIISCTASPHTVVHLEDLPEKEMLIFDLAVPRDVDVAVSTNSCYEVHDIDSIGRMTDENLELRKSNMDKNRYLVEEAIKEYLSWKQLKTLSPYIVKIRDKGERQYMDRYHTFKNKKDSKNIEHLAKTMLKSTSDAYTNRAIEVLKEEYLKGRGEECLRIIEKIFLD